ncbi:MAG TPA: response regulator [Gemmatimonas aurantiaca]|uniref:Response regulator n=2 Tax=Gemmatimonas aurantiaca TaxID=173480 RepID=C1A5Y3_GEMAT|nr:response regulator [Gemmatimonas aurantiaca]BAH37643.1 response regulator [Gemmatimonas aurantiaca T-27]HCT58678.1 response regulator [Gemmatimonas aurantiaca]
MPRVLIVDDEPGIRFALKRWFERQHWTVEEAADGAQALELLRASNDEGESRLDVVVCDLHLPQMAGDEIVREIGETRPELAARVILTTGDAVHDATPGSVLAQHKHVLQKPFDLGTLREVVHLIHPIN